MPNVDISSINVIAELERCGISFEMAADDELKVCCPFHDDTKPSCALNIQKRVFVCHTAGCGQSGDFITFLAKALNSTRRVILEDLSTRYDLKSEKTIDSSTVERFHRDIWAAGPMLKELKARGVNDKLIRQYRLGYHNGRITIPIPNSKGLYVNIRKYLPGAPGPQKMRNARGYGGIRLYPYEQLSYDRIVICGGELKALVAANLLNRYGIGAITATAGEGNWEAEFSRLLRGKQVWVCFDIDEEGRAASNRVCARIRSEARTIHRVDLPLDPEQHPKGDINDWVGIDLATSKDFLTLLESCDIWVPSSMDLYDDSEDAESKHLAEAVKADNTGKRIAVNAIVSALATAPYVVPHVVRCVCDRDQPDHCGACPVFAITPDENGQVRLEVPVESPAILEMVAAPKSAMRDAILGGLRLPRCKTVDLAPITFRNVEDARLSPQLEISDRTTDQMMQPALCVGHGLEMNEPYNLVGRMFPNPKTQESVLLISKSTPTRDALSSYDPTSDELEQLQFFQPTEWTTEALGLKLDDLYSDLETNVTQIYLRRDLHLVIDLIYHSVLLFDFDGRETKGWAEGLILGDSSQGKSETTQQLMKHYGLGESVECKNASVAGLLGGLQQMGNKWFVTWGIIPTHDKRLVILEELKGADPEVISKLTNMRSSGVAEIPKIEKRRTHARTRLIALSNPRSEHPLSSYNFGVDAVRELVGALEDIRRFDITLLVSSEEIDASTLNELQRSRPNVDHRYTKDLCRRCVLWAWTRRPSQIIFTDDARNLILDEATKLCSTYSESIPIVDRGSQRFKIARLAIALACRTFSCSHRDLQKVIVRDCHVQFVCDMLKRVYSSRVFGYADYSNASKSSNQVVQPTKIEAKLLETPFPSDVVEQLLHTEYIELRDICDWCGWNREEGLQLLSFFVRKRALRRYRSAYRKTPSFIELLKQIQVSKKLQILDRPGHVPDIDVEF